MLLYGEDRKLEGLLEELFLGDDESATDEVSILGLPIDLFSLSSFGNCCIHNYTNYGG